MEKGINKANLIYDLIGIEWCNDIDKNDIQQNDLHQNDT